MTYLKISGIGNSSFFEKIERIIDKKNNYIVKITLYTENGEGVYIEDVYIIKDCIKNPELYNYMSFSIEFENIEESFFLAFEESAILVGYLSYDSNGEKIPRDSNIEYKNIIPKIVFDEIICAIQSDDIITVCSIDYNENEDPFFSGDWSNFKKFVRTAVQIEG